MVGNDKDGAPDVSAILRLLVDKNASGQDLDN